MSNELDKYQNQYRIPSARASWWDYGQNGLYFVTICTKNRDCYFGHVCSDEMQLSEIGIIAQQCWMEIPQHFPFIRLDAFTIMPNHVHGIVIIDKHADITTVETQDFASLQLQSQSQSSSSSSFNCFGPQSRNLASVIRGYKIGVKKNACLLNPCFAWQSRFHDHIIRNYESHERIVNYIINNPALWKNDKHYQS
jgi:REP element-mobilizing transposase RayT